MARNYSVVGNATNTASSTLPIVTLISTAAVRPLLVDFTMGSDAVADNACKYAFQRCTTAGTAGSSITPQAFDPADPVSVVTSGLAIFSAGPTLTANAIPLQWGQNQRATYRWVAVPGKEIKLPATASNGLALMPLIIGSFAFNCVFTLIYEE